MATIGSMVFCADCGNLLPAATGSEKGLLKCECCGAVSKGRYRLGPVHAFQPPRMLPLTLLVPRVKDAGSKTIVTKSKPADFPSFLRQKLQSTVQAIDRNTVNTQGTVNERCRNCGREEVRYTTVQLRSADEGSTVIYSCECGNSCDIPFTLHAAIHGESPHALVPSANASPRWHENN